MSIEIKQVEMIYISERKEYRFLLERNKSKR